MTPVPGAVVVAWLGRACGWARLTCLCSSCSGARARMVGELGPALKVLVERSRVQQRHRDAAEKYIRELEEKVKRAVDGGTNE